MTERDTPDRTRASTADTRRRWASPGVLVALAFCAAFPWVWNAFFPVYTGEPVTVRLTRPRAADAIELPADVRAARRIRIDTREGEQRMLYGVEVPAPGPHTVYGISANRQAQPLELQVNDRFVSSNAFYQKTGRMREGFERHRIARGVRFEPGENLVGVAGERAMYRTLVLELRPEAPLGAARFAWLFAVAATGAWARGAVVRRAALPPPVRLAAAAAGTLVCLGAIPVLWYEASGGALVALGHQDPLKVSRQARLELHLRSEPHRRAAAEKFTVFLMGDSTHYWSLPPEHHLPAAVRRALGESDYEVDGLSGGALNAFDYYLLLHRIAAEQPDLVVIPVSLRSFSEKWLRNERYRYHGMDHYLSLRGFLDSRGLAVAGREITAPGWILRSLDARWLHGEAEHLLRGAKVFFQNEKDRIARRLERAMPASWQPLPAGLALQAIPEYPEWNTRIPPDHELLEAFRLINRLAARRGIEILYYTERVNVAAQREAGVDVRAEANLATIESQIAGAPGVHFLALASDVPRGFFMDDIDHLTAEGMDHLARELARAIRALRREREAGASAVGEQPGA